jgi:hypothetical protein
VIRPGELVSADVWSVTLPSGETQTAAQIRELQEAAGIAGAAEKESRQLSMSLTEPGRYIVTGQTEEGESSVMLIAGLSALESRTEMLPIGQLQALGVGVTRGDAASGSQDSADAEAMVAGQLSASELEKKQKWWRWLLLSGLGCLVLESLWAAAIERRQAVA